tara:strand:- start:2094 stop:2945 length:852 start_codon:yes stop_codon:yes gene_type:complete
MRKLKNRILKLTYKIIEYLNSDFKLSRSSNKKYPEYCKIASEDNEVFQNFRNNSSYTSVLEHVSPELSKEYYQALKNLNYSDDYIYSICKILDQPGNPRKIKVNNSISELTGSSLRYLYTGLDIKNKLNLNKVINIVEIGAGYGGQSVILDKILPIENYFYVDLQEVNQLIDRFVGNFNVNFNYTFNTLEDKFDFDSEFDLVISNYAFSELPRNLQNLALNKIINNSKNGYMIINSHGLEKNIFLKKYDLHTVDELKKLIPNLLILEEYPQSHKNNKLLTFSR